MLPRTLTISKKMSFFLFGARGTGKSTWLQQQFDEAQHLWLDLTNPKVHRRYARRPEILLDEWTSLVRTRKGSGEEVWVVVDEVQKIPEILDVAHVGIQRHKIKFALTGSSARKLKRGTANLLAGRALTYRMYPFTWIELKDRFVLEEYLEWGGLPMLQQIDLDQERQKYLLSYLDTYIREEIQIEQLVRKIEPFRMFVDVVGQMNGEVINIARIAKEAGIEAKNGERYFEILADTLLGFYLPSYERSIRKSQLRHPKFYLFDVGVARAIRGELSLRLEPHTGAYGRAFEHFILQQVRAINDNLNAGFRMAYLRTKDGNEIDLVLERPGKCPLFVEIKATARPEELSLRNFEALAKEAKAEAILICRASRSIRIGKIAALPWQEALRKIFGISEVQ